MTRISIALCSAPVPLFDKVTVKSVNGVPGSPTVMVMPATVVGRIPALATINTGSVSVTGSDPKNLSTSVENRNALVSPAVQPWVMSPPGGAHTALPSLSTTSGENVSPHSLLVGSESNGTRTIAGPSALNPPWAGFCWLPAGVQ